MVLVSLIILGGVFLGFILTLRKSLKRKLIIWGIITMFIITPFLGWIISILVGIIEGDGFAAVGMMMLLFPTFFIIGLVLLIVGFFRKEAF
ncbi:hypothetical protein FG384_06870 [Psychrobacillus vulpis]|uniref:Uncharacterized protein n=1 Tax=Psychrobacillus vulpis TaxID=2325572 RepID=A0A544TT16_9BACI|nr:hypothetical protein FG384_06870 [Psychrobacillus vulpis]